MAKKVIKKLPAGVRKVKSNAKMCWISKQDKNGWSLGLALGKETLWVKGVRFPSSFEVERVVKLLPVVFVNLKGIE
jgi:hypothetical protein